MNQSNAVSCETNRGQRGAVTVKDVAYVCYFLFWLLKPFYVWDSGSIQPGDVFLGLSFVALLFSNNFRAYFSKTDKFFYLFFLCVCIINFLYFAFLQSFSFLKVLLYYIFNFLVIYLFRSFANEPKFFKIFANVLRLNIIVQFVLLITGIGEWYTASRYLGTYNDPNQFGFGILSTYCLLFCIGRIITVKGNWLYFVLSAYLIYQSSSTGMLMAIAILFVCEQYFRVVTIKSLFNRSVYIVYLMLITIAFLYLGIELVKVLSSGETDVSFLKRLSDKLDRGDSFIESFIQDRNLYALINAPINILYGSGESMMSRFASSSGELHSTWLALLFSYGIVPFSFLICWIRQNMKRIDPYVLPVYLCLFVEALTLVNHRQPSFWTLIILASFTKRKSYPSDLREQKMILGSAVDA